MIRIIGKKPYSHINFVQWKSVVFISDLSISPFGHTETDMWRDIVSVSRVAYESAIRACKSCWKTQGFPTPRGLGCWRSCDRSMGLRLIYSMSIWPDEGNVERMQVCGRWRLGSFNFWDMCSLLVPSLTFVDCMGAVCFMRLVKSNPCLYPVE